MAHSYLGHWKWGLQLLCLIFSAQSTIGDHMSSDQTVEYMYNDTKALKEELLEIGGYDKTTRPRLYQREQVDIMMLFGLYSIYGINEVTESFTTCGYMSISWYDDLLTWDPESHRNQTFIELPQRQVWTPEISLTNAVEFNEPMGSDDSLMIVQSDGYVRRWTFQVYTATCSLDITYYPFDEHDCTLDFSVIGYGYNEVNVNSTASYTYMDYFTLNSEWEVAQKGVEESGDDRGDPNLSFKFHFKRRPGYVLMTSVMPVILLSVMNLAVFLLPSNGGEKAGFAVAVVLSFAVFMTLVLASFPRNSLVLSVFAIYLLYLTSQSTILAILSLLLVRLASFDECNKPIYPFLLCLYDIFHCVKCKSRKSVTEVVEIKLDQNLNTKPESDVNKENESDNEKGTHHGHTWLEITNFLDLVFFVLFMSTLVIVTLVFFILIV